MTDITSALEHLKLGLSIFGESLGLIKKVRDLLPNSKEKEELEKQILEVEKSAKIAEVEIARAFGYKLCKCTFPPQIMLSVGYSKSEHTTEEEFKCSKCGKSSISPVNKGLYLDFE